MTSTTGPRNSARRQSGLTLIELILVMVIICTVLAMAAPSLGGFFGSRRTADAAAQIVALAHYARTQAATEGRVFRLNVDPAEGTYSLTHESGGVFVKLGNEFGRTFSLPDGTRAAWEARPGDPPRDYVAFWPEGRTEASTLRLTGRRGEVFDVVCRSPAERFHVVSPSEAVEP